MPVLPIKANKKRYNWGKVENIVRLIKAVNDWDNNTDNAMDTNDENLRLVHF